MKLPLVGHGQAYGGSFRILSLTPASLRVFDNGVDSRRVRGVLPGWTVPMSVTIPAMPDRGEVLWYVLSKFLEYAQLSRVAAMPAGLLTSQKEHKHG